MANDRRLPRAESISRLLDAYTKTLEVPAALATADALSAYPVGTAMSAMNGIGLNMLGCTVAEMAYGYAYADAVPERDLIRLTFITTPPAVATQAVYNYEVEDGTGPDKWPRLKQTFVLLRSGYTKGMAVTAPPAASGTGWTRTGEREANIPDERLHALFVVLEVFYSTTAATRTDYKFNPETGTLITTVAAWVANTAGAPPVPAQSSGVNVTQEQVSELWSLRLTETNAAVTGYKLAVPSIANVNLPDTLVSVDVEWSEQSGEGSGETNWAGSATGSSWSLTSQTGASAESSGAVLPELVVVTKQTWGHNLPSTIYYMIVEKVAGEITLAMVTAQLASLYGVTATQWPVFHPKTYVVALSGNKVNITAQVSAHASMSYSSSSLSWSRTTSGSKHIDHSLTTGTRVIPNVLCSGLSISQTRTKDVSAVANLGFYSGLIPTFSFTDPEITESCSGFAKGRFDATTPSAIPTSGKYMLNVAVRPFQNLSGFMMIAVEVIDASVFA